MTRDRVSVRVAEPPPPGRWFRCRWFRCRWVPWRRRGRVARAARIAAVLAVAVLTVVVPTVVVGGSARAAGPRSPAETRVEVAYEVRLDDPASRRVEVEARVAGAPAGAVELTLPEGFAFVRLAEPLLEGEVIGELADGPAEVTRLGPYRWRVATDGGPLTLRWAVPHRFRELAEVRQGRDAYEYPYVADDHAMLSTSVLLLAISRVDADREGGAPADAADGDDGDGPRASVRFAVPEGWEVRAPWPREGDRYLPPDRRALQGDLIALGAWDVTDVTAEGARVSVAFAPGQGAARDRITRQVAPVLKAALVSFDHRPFERYLVLFGRPDQPGFGGSPKATSMTLTVDPAMLASAGDGAVLHLIAHEFHHTWAMSRYDAPDDLRFFGEGFTDYYAHVLPERLGLTDPSAVASAVASAAATWETSPRQDLSLAAAGGPVFFEDRDAYDLVYAGGLVVAAVIDAHLMAAGQGDLDDVMQDLNNDPRWTKGGAAPDLDALFDVLRRHLDPAFADEVRAWVTAPGFPGGDAIVGSLRDLGVAARRVVEPAPLDLRVNFDGLTVVAMDPNDAARRVGIREGDRIVEVNGVEVAGEADVRSAWAAPVEGRVRVRLVRDAGAGDEEVEIDVPRPDRVRYEISPAPWG